MNSHMLHTQVVYGNESGWYDSVASGNVTAYVQTYADHSYISGAFHHVRLAGLQDNTTYFFKYGPSALWQHPHCS